MPDLLTCLALGWAPPQFIKELSSVDVSFSPSAFLRKAGSAVVDALSSTLVSEHKRSVQQLLIRLCIPQDTPHPWDDCTAVFCLRGAHMQFCMRRCAVMAGVVEAALSTLEVPDDKAALAAAAVAVNNWDSCVSSNPLMTCAMLHGPGDIAGLLMGHLTYIAVSSLMHDTVMRQLQGLQAVEDWELVIKALKNIGAVLPYHAASDWAAVEVQFLELKQRQQQPSGLRQWALSMSKQLSQDTVTCEKNPEYGLAVALPARLKQACTLDCYRAAAFKVLVNYITLEFEGLMPAIDATHHCWCFSLYWLDLVGLALQQAGGQPGPAAVAAAQQLMREKHSVFLASRMLAPTMLLYCYITVVKATCNICALCDATIPCLNVLQASAAMGGHLHAYIHSTGNESWPATNSPLKLDRQLRRLIITRGDVKAAALMSANEATAARSSDAGNSSILRVVHARAITMFSGSSAAASSSSGSLLDVLRPQVDSFFTWQPRWRGSFPKTTPLCKQAASGQQLCSVLLSCC
ncbi:hypothetical protein COO60DRAFT_1469249 [Scenedesmus sp. NREL 46B-D3]|nr:hypothetical protein COO60DRAFT_1469249 [Scenedesmus sp. NREL 46B-D3]